MRLNSVRISYFIGFLIVVGLLGMAAYIEIHDGVHPCPLCELQRFILVGLGMIFFIGGLFKFNRIGQIILGIFGFLTAGLGILFSGRQVFIQHMPANSLGECGISLQYLFKIFSFNDALKQLWVGGTECSQHNWEFLNLSLAEWSMIAFVLLFLFVIVQLMRTRTE